MREALALSELRTSRDVTQQALADALDVTQPNVSRIEHEDDVFLSTLRSYVEALGGRLEVRAVFDDLTVDLEVPRT
jgi:transcriptional regulator with XRE-family HTH domain